MKRIWKYFSSLSKGYQIVSVVFAVHGTLILWGMTDHLLNRKNKRKQAMIVRTVQPFLPIVAVSSPAVISALPQKKMASTASAKKTTLPSIKPLKKEQKLAVNTEFLGELTKSLEALQSSQPKKLSGRSLSIPQNITCKPELENAFQKNNSYAENLIALLTSSLDLPEFGAVKACLQIDASGSVINCKILEEKSRKNSEFLKNRLRELTFPCFNDFGLSDSQLEFTVTFRNLEK